MGSMEVNQYPIMNVSRFWFTIRGVLILIYQHILIPPTLQSVRLKFTIQKKPRPASAKIPAISSRRKRKVPGSCAREGGWAISQNEHTGIYCATKILDPDDILTSDVIDEKPIQTPSSEDQSRLKELEQELADLKKSLAQFKSIESPIHTPQTPNLDESPLSTVTPLNSTLAMKESSKEPKYPLPPTPPPPKVAREPEVKEVIPPLPPPPPPAVKPIPAIPIGLKAEQSSETTILRSQSLSDILHKSKPSLKPTALNRSPGGTPVKQKETNFFVTALRKKFKMVSSSQVETDTDADSDKENAPCRVNSTDSVVSESEWDASPAASPVRLSLRV